MGFKILEVFFWKIRAIVLVGFALCLFQTLYYGISLGATSDQEESVLIRHADRFENFVVDGQFVSKFIGNVVVTHGRTVITCSQATYFEAKGEVALRGNVTINDQGGMLTADRVEYSERTRRAVAYGDPVKIDRGKVVAQCGKAILLNAENRLILKGKPVVWQEDNELKGKEMVLTLDGFEVTRVDAVGDAIGLSISPPDSVDGSSHINELGGKKMTLWLKDEVAEQLIAEENATCVNIFMEGDEERVKNEASGDRITLFFNQGAIERVLVEGGAMGTYYAPVSEEGAATELDTVRYQAEAIDYRVDDKTIYFQGKDRIDYHRLTLTAEQITFLTEPRVLIAEGVADTTGELIGAPILEEDGEKIEGSRLVYNLRTERGKIRQGRTKLEKGFYTGEKIRLVAERTFNLDHGAYTTCEENEPHYHFYSRRMRLYADDKVIAKPVVLYVRDVPVFALPFWVFSIKKDRHSGFLIPRYGSRGVDGRYLRDAGYYFAPSDYWDALVKFSFYERTGWLLESRFRYAIRYLLNGSIEGSIKEDRRLGRRRWDLRFSHSQFLQQSTSLKVSGNFVSDKRYYPDIGDAPEERMQRTLRSHAFLDKRWAENSLRVTISQRRNLDSGETVEQLPAITFRRPKSPIFKKEAKKARRAKRGKASGEEYRWYHLLYYSYGLDLVNYRQRFGATDSLDTHVGINHRLRFSSPQKLFGWLGFTPSFNYQETWYDKDRRGKKYVRRSIYDAHLSVNTNLYGIFHTRVGKLRAVRHMVMPRISFSYRPDFPDRERFYTFGGIGAIPGPQKRVGLRLENLFQAKTEEEGKYKKNDLAHLGLYTGYDFEAARFDYLSSSLRIFPSPAFNVDVRATHDLYDPDTGEFAPFNPRLKDIQVTTTIRLGGRKRFTGGVGSKEDSKGIGATSPGSSPKEKSSITQGRPWSLSLSHHYSSSKSHWMRAKMAIPLTKKWKVDYSASFDLRDRKFTYQSFTFNRDMHCWEGKLVWVPTGYKKGYYFRINIKAIPEIKVEKAKGVSGLRFGKF